MPNIEPQFNQPQPRKQPPPFDQLPISDTEQVRQIFSGSDKGSRQMIRELVREEDAATKQLINKLLKSIEAGKRQKKHDRTRYNELLEGVAVPNTIVSRLNTLLGRESDDKIKGPNLFDSETSFHDKSLAKQLECSNEEAAHLIGLTIMLDLKNDMMSIYRNPDIILKYTPDLNIDEVKKLFPNPGRIDRITGKFLEHSISVLGKQCSVKGISYFINTAIREKLNPDKNSVKKTFGTDERKKEFLDLFKEDINPALEKHLKAYEYIFGELSRSEFLKLFPNWRDAKSYNSYTYTNRFLLDSSYSVPKWRLSSEKVELPKKPRPPKHPTEEH
ncbi:MAG: hypothetical protein ABID45_02770, partial [Patescibacteria group bacterium]